MRNIVFSGQTSVEFLALFVYTVDREKIIEDDA